MGRCAGAGVAVAPLDGTLCCGVAKRAGFVGNTVFISTQSAKAGSRREWQGHEGARMRASSKCRFTRKSASRDPEHHLHFTEGQRNRCDSNCKARQSTEITLQSPSIVQRIVFMIVRLSVYERLYVVRSKSQEFMSSLLFVRPQARNSSTAWRHSVQNLSTAPSAKPFSSYPRLIHNLPTKV